MELKNFLTNAVQLLLTESLEQEFADAAKSIKTNGRILNPQEAEELQREIKGHYDGNMFGTRSNDIRQSIYNYDHPYAKKILNGVDLRITEGLIKNKQKTFLLYADGKIIGEFYSTDDIKNLVKAVETKLKT